MVPMTASEITHSARYRSTWSVNAGTVFEGVTGVSHNSVLNRTVRLFSGQGYRSIPTEGRRGHRVLFNGTDRVEIDIEAVA